MDKGHLDKAKMVRNIIPKEVECIFVRQAEQLGLGHAILCAERALNNEAFVVILADDFIVNNHTRIIDKMIKHYVDTGKSQISVMKVDGPDISKYGVVETTDKKGEVKGLIEKPNACDAPSNLASIGRYVLDSKIFDYLRKQNTGVGGEIQLADAINEQAKNGGVESLELEGKRFDCGSVDGYLDAIQFMAKRRSNKF